MRVDEVFKQAASQGTTPVSFEMFPPKGELTLDTAREVAGNLCKLSPSFVSVTCSAGGSGNGATTAPIAHIPGVRRRVRPGSAEPGPSVLLRTRHRHRPLPGSHRRPDRPGP